MEYIDDIFTKSFIERRFMQLGALLGVQEVYLPEAWSSCLIYNNPYIVEFATSSKVMEEASGQSIVA